MSVGRVPGVAQHQGVGVVVEPFQEPVSDLGGHQQPGAGQAHLSRVVELPGRSVGGSVEIGVGEHHERSLAAQLGGERDDVGRRGLSDVAGGLGRSGERDAAHPGVGHQRSSYLLADALHQVVGAGGESGLLGELGQERRRQRRPLGRFVDDAVARGQRRGQLPGC